MNSTLLDILTSLALYTDIVQSGQKEIVWRLWCTTFDGFQGHHRNTTDLVNHGASMAKVITIAEVGDILVEAEKVICAT